MTLERIIAALVESDNEAADDTLLEALRLGNEPERAIALDALFQRETTHGLSEVIGLYEKLSQEQQTEILRRIKTLHHAIREAGRSDRQELRLAAMKLVAIGRQGKLAYVLSENLYQPSETVSQAAMAALVSMARWVSMETRRLQRGPATAKPAEETSGEDAALEKSPELMTDSDLYRQLMEQRPEIEQAVARAMDGTRGKHSAELLRAGLLLCDWPLSKTLAILNTTKHGGQSAMVRRLQQPPASEHVEAFLLGASHGGLRSHFGVTFSHIEEAPVLDALLRKTHWLKDQALQSCVHLVTRGPWWGETEMNRDVSRRHPADAVRIGEWIAVSGVHDVVQDDRLERLRTHCATDFPSRVRLLRIAAGRKRGSSVQLIKAFLNDPDERLVRMAARELIRRKPAEYENSLLQLMVAAPDSVRKVISRAVGQSGFEQFWNKFDRLDKNTRRQAGKAMLKLLPDAVQRLTRKLQTGLMEQRIKALQIVQELKLADSVKDVLLALCEDPQPRIRSKAVGVLGDVPAIAPDVLIQRLLTDTDSRVRANTIEVLEAQHRTTFLPMLIQRARVGGNRERANAIKVLHRLHVGVFGTALQAMLNDPRPEHRISAMWALKQTGWWNLIGMIGQMAKQDGDARVRRYALNLLKAVSQMFKEQQAATPVPAPKLAG